MSSMQVLLRLGLRRLASWHTQPHTQSWLQGLMTLWPFKEFSRAESAISAMSLTNTENLPLLRKKSWTCGSLSQASWWRILLSWTSSSWFPRILWPSMKMSSRERMHASEPLHRVVTDNCLPTVAFLNNSFSLLDSRTGRHSKIFLVVWLISGNLELVSMSSTASQLSESLSGACNVTSWQP